MSSIQRITGMNSGLDVDALVKASMTTYKNKIDKETQNQKILEYQQEQYKKIMKDASDFHDKYFDILKTGNLFSTSTYQSVSFKSGDDTKVTAKGFAGADVSNYNVTVTQLASKATASFTKSDLTGADKDKLYVKFGSKEASVGIIKADGEIDMSATAKKLNEELNKQGINISAKYSEFSKSIILESGEMGENGKFSVVASNDTSKGLKLLDPSNTHAGTNAKGIITRGTEIYNINNKSNVITVDNVQFTLKAPSISATAGETLEHLTDWDVGNGETTTSDGKTTTKSADGNTITTTKVANGIITQTITLIDGATTKKMTTKSNTDGTVIQKIDSGTVNQYTSISLSGSTDVTALKDKIVSFINDYNTLLSSINTKLYEKRDKNYLPLTDEQKKEMTDDQIEKWETKAQAGLLRKDSDLERITNTMKNSMSSVISGTGLYLEKIGIKPVKDYAEKNGMYTVDESKLTQALQENAGSVKDLFTRAASDTDKKDKGGILTQLKAVINDEFKKGTSILSKKVGLDGTNTQYDNALSKSINEKKQLVKQLNYKLSDRENALYKKYSALEKALQSLNSQQSSLTSMLGMN